MSAEEKPEVADTKRVMTIARGLGRLKTIKAQVDNIASDIRDFGMWSSMSLSPLSQKKDIKENHREAEAVMKQKLQSFQDLTLEASKIKLAIKDANSANMITVAGKTISIAYALVLRGFTMNMYRTVNSAYDSAIYKAQAAVDRHNASIKNIENAAARAAVVADVAYFVSKKDADELRAFITEFDAEVDNLLNEANSRIEIEID